MLWSSDNLETLLKEFKAIDLVEMMKKRTTEKVIKAAVFSEAPKVVELTEDQCLKLCDKSGLRYRSGYERRVIERVTTTEQPDRYGDIVRYKGVDNSNYRKNAVVMFAHEHDNFPVGKSLKEWMDHAIKGWRSWDLYFDDDVDTTGRSDLTFRMVESGAMPAGSIGFMPKTANYDLTPKEREAMGLGKFGVEYVTCEKLEHSACSIPANPECLSNFLKSVEAKRLQAVLGKTELDRMEAQKMLDGNMLDVFASMLGVKRTVSLPADVENYDPIPRLMQGETIKDVVLRPYPNEHVARVRDPEDFEDDSFRRKKVTTGVGLILGKLKDGDGSMVAQAYRFSADEFTADEAKKWLKDNDVKYISFEPAAEKAIANIQDDITPLLKEIIENFKKPPSPVPINITNNNDFTTLTELLGNVGEQIKALCGKLEDIQKSQEEKFNGLMSTTNRALAALEARTNKASLYDRKDVESIKSILQAPIR